jgi:hypothetical protein
MSSARGKEIKDFGLPGIESKTIKLSKFPFEREIYSQQQTPGNGVKVLTNWLNAHDNEPFSRQNFLKIAMD